MELCTDYAKVFILLLNFLSFSCIGWPFVGFSFAKMTCAGGLEKLSMATTRLCFSVFFFSLQSNVIFPPFQNPTEL